MCVSVDLLSSVDQTVLHNKAQYFDTNDVEKYKATIGLHKAEARPLERIKTRTPEEMLCPFKVYISIEGGRSRRFVL